MNEHLPSDAEIIKLVERFYSPQTNSDEIGNIQRYLQNLQKSPYGWHLAFSLLQTESPNCQFFGALTYTVKINTYDTVFVTDNDPPAQKLPAEILSEILSILVSLNSKPNSSNFVIRKLLSTLSRFFSRFYAEWPHCIGSVIATVACNSLHCEVNGQNIPAILQQLDERTANLCLEFAQMLIEDVSTSHNLNATQSIHIANTLRENVEWLSLLLDYCCHALYSKTESDALLDHAFKTYGAWTVHFRYSNDIPNFLLPITVFIFDYIKNKKDDALMHTAVEEVVEIIDRYPSFYSPELRQFLGEILVETGRPLAEAIMQKSVLVAKSHEVYSYSNDSEAQDMEEFATDFVKIAIALCESEIEKPDRLNSAEIATLFEYLLVFSSFPGIPYVDHKLSMYLLEFWNNYVDSFSEESGSVDVSESNPIIAKVIEVFWNKSAYPPPSVKSIWNFETREAFDSFRKDFWELIEMAYPLMKDSLFSTLCNNILENISLENPNWVMVEASLSCITCLADTVPLSNEFELLSQLLSSSLFPKLCELNDFDVRVTAVNFIGNYDSFFELDIGRPFLFDALDYLFKSLNFTQLSNTASRSILKLCSSSRSFLAGNLVAFFDTYNTMKLFERLDNMPHQRTILAIASVTQALKNVELRAEYISRLIESLAGELDKAYSSYESLHCAADSPLMQNLFDRITSLLRCVANVGKGLQEPDDFSDLLEHEFENLAEFWDEDRFKIRSRVMEILKVFAIQRNKFSSSIPIIEASCDILKSGFSERTPGPFVFPIGTILEFIQSKISTADAFSILANFSTCFVTSHSVGRSVIPDYYINSLIEIFSSHLTTTLQTEPDSQAAFLKFLNQLACQYMDVFLTNPKCEGILTFAASKLSSHETFVLRESVKFWTTFIMSKSSNTSQFLLQIGPSLVEILVAKISGDADRSELDYYIDVIKQLILRKMLVSKPWFERSLILDPATPVTKVGLDRRNRILKQLMNLRGGKETNFVVKEYWLNARGITNYT